MRNVYERRAEAPSLPDTVNYLLPFHMLAAGPIQAYGEFTQRSVLPAQTPVAALRACERIA